MGGSVINKILHFRSLTVLYIDIPGAMWLVQRMREVASKIPDQTVEEGQRLHWRRLQ
jgi:hypothetical protein